MARLHELTINEAHGRLLAREISAVELTQDCLERIQQVEDEVKSFLSITGDQALEQAKHADQQIASGKAGPLTGIPVQIKDVISTRGVNTTCGSRMLQDYVPVYNATVMDKIEQQGAVMVGKGNMDEFAMGSSTENSAYHSTHNPWDLTRVPGGSSGGGAACVAAQEAIYAIGSDTGGSVRQPASLCGVVGMKPTYGLVSRYGLVAFASSLDQIGPITRDVRDCALVLTAITGHDPKDSTSLAQQPQNYTLVEGEDHTSSPLAQSGGERGVRLGVPEEYFVEGMESGVREAVHAAIESLESLGATIEPVSLPTTEYALACYYIIAPSECSANLSRYDGVKSVSYTHLTLPTILLV